MQSTLENPQLKTGLVDADTCIRTSAILMGSRSPGLFKTEEKLLSPKPIDQDKTDIQREVA
jgi:hypothetical protein